MHKGTAKNIDTGIRSEMLVRFQRSESLLQSILRNIVVSQQIGAQKQCKKEHAPDKAADDVCRDLRADTISVQRTHICMDKQILCSQHMRTQSTKHRIVKTAGSKNKPIIVVSWHNPSVFLIFLLFLIQNLYFVSL
jgi:hypothetical protein